MISSGFQLGFIDIPYVPSLFELLLLPLLSVAAGVTLVILLDAKKVLDVEKGALSLSSELMISKMVHGRLGFMRMWPSNSKTRTLRRDRFSFRSLDATIAFSLQGKFQPFDREHSELDLESSVV